MKAIGILFLAALCAATVAGTNNPAIKQCTIDYREAQAECTDNYRDCKADYFMCLCTQWPPVFSEECRTEWLDCRQERMVCMNEAWVESVFCRQNAMYRY